MSYNFEHNMGLNNYFNDKFTNLDENYIYFLKRTRANLLSSYENGLFVDFTCNIGQDIASNMGESDLGRTIQLLLNSGDVNKVNYGRFLYNLVYKMNILLNEETKKIILDSIFFDNNNQININVKMGEVESLSYSCMIKILYKHKKDSLVTDLLQKMVNNTLQEEEEFNVLIKSLLLKKRNGKNDMFEFVVMSYKEAYKIGDKQIVMDNLRKLIILTDMYGLKFKTSTEGSYWSEYDNTIYFDKNICSSLTVFHEFGHAIDTYFNKRKHGKKEKIYEQARQHALNCSFLSEEIVKLNIQALEKIDAAKKEYTDVIMKQYGSVENIIKVFSDYAKKMIDNYGIEATLDLYGISGTTKKTVLENYQKGTIDLNHIAKFLMETSKIEYAKRRCNDIPEGAMLDIFSAVFKSNQIYINNVLHTLAISHSSKYYYMDKDLAMCEIMADYNEIKISGREDLIDKLRMIFGDEFVNIVESYYYTSQNKEDVSIVK